MFRIYFFFLTIALLLLLSSCSSNRPNTIAHNESIRYEIGFPSASINSHGFYDDIGNIKITITSEIIPESLISISNDSVREGHSITGFVVNYEVMKRGEGNQEKYTDTETFELNLDNSNRKQSEDGFKFLKSFELEEPGTYDIRVTIEDLISKKNIVMNDVSIIPELNDEDIGLSSITLSGRENDSSEFTVITNYEVTKDYVELLFENQITNGSASDSINIEAKILRFESDNEPAQRMRDPEFRVFTLQKNGINYNATTEVFKQERVLVATDNILSYDVGFETPEIGNYRFIISVIDNKTGEEIARAFDFGVKRDEYPYVRTPRHLAEPLIYLMDEKAHSVLMKTENPDSLKIKVDDFWLRNIKNADKAKKSIELYYERVEESNKLFSTYKEGWKTDFGMIYILFGPPMYTRKTFNFIQWSYSNDRYSDRYNYFFNLERRPTNNFPFSVYLLDRSNQELDNNEYRIVEDWLSGNVVN